MTPAPTPYDRPPSTLLANRYVPWAIALLIAVLVMVFWVRLVEQNRREHLAILEANANWVVSEVTGHVEPLALALVRMASRAALRDAMERREWAEDASLYAEHFPGYLAVLWLEADGRIRWSQQPEAIPGDTGAIPASLDLLERGRAACPPAHEPYTLCAFTIPHDGVGLMISSPIVRGGRIAGYMVGIFDTRQTFAAPVLPDFSPFMEVRLRQGDSPIARRGPSSTALDAPAPQLTRAIPLAGLDWQVDITDQTNLIPRGLPSLPTLLLAAGLLLASLLGFLIHLAQQAVLRARHAQHYAERFRQIAESIREVFWISDLDRNELLYLSPAYETLWGRSREGLYPQSEKVFLQHLHPDDAERIRARRLESFEHNSEFDEDFRILLPDGGCRWINVHSFPVASRSGRGSQVVGIAEDITGRKEAECELRLALDKYRNLVETTEDWVWEIDAEHRYIYTNPRCIDLLGYTPDEILGLTPFDLMPAAEAERVAAIYLPMAARHQTIKSLRNVNLRKDGSEVVLETSGTPVVDDGGQLLGYRGIDRDITARIEIENALRASEAELRLITDALPAVIAYIDSEQRFRFSNRAFKEWFGLDSGQVYLRHWREILDPGAHDRIEQRIERALAGEAVRFEDEITYPRIGKRQIAGNYIPDRGANGEVVGVFAMITDVTPIVHARQDLAESEERFRHLAENIQEIFFITDGETRNLLYVSPAYEKVWGLSLEGRFPDLEKVFFAHLHPDDAARVRAERERCYRLKAPFIAEFRTLQTERGIRWVRVRATPTLEPDGGLKHYVGIAEDITQRKQLEEERIARVEQQRDLLIREIHHRIKNTLQGVGGLLQRHLSNHPDTQEALREAIAQIHSIAAVYGLQSRVTQTPVDVQGLLEAIIATTRQTNLAVELDLRFNPTCCLPAHCHTRVEEREAVPLALVINELLANAIKHQPGDNKRVEIIMQCEDAGVALGIRNPSPPLPVEFDLDAGIGLGTGLRLVKSLLPRGGARLTIDHEAGQTQARLRLSPPVLAPDKGGKTDER